MSEKRTCKITGNEFEILEDEKSFYDKIGVPIPDICPEERARLRLLHRNERSLYKRVCDKTGESIVSVFSPNKPDTVWKYEAWFADDWDATSYGQDYDPNRSFFEQFKELQSKVPKPALLHVRSVNSEYVNLAADNKNCYMVVESSNNEDCTNCYWIQKCTNCADVSFSHQCEMCYECDDCYGCYRVQESQSCHDSTDCLFCIDCRGCMNCVGCVNLHQQKYCILNEQFTKEEYEEKLALLALDTYEGREKFKAAFVEFAQSQPRKYAEIVNAPNCTGNYIKNAKNCKNCFHCYDAEDCINAEHVWRNAKDCVDVSTAGRNAERIFNSLNAGIDTSDYISCNICWSCSFMYYSAYCFNSTNCFGCFGLRKKNYCILNKQYSKEEYETLKDTIIKDMKERGEWGQFFPPELSLFGYNETVAQDQYPLEKTEASAKGFKWEDTPRGIFGKGNVDWNEFDEKEASVEDITQKVFSDKDTDQNYRFIVSEVNLLQQINAPLPHKHPDERHLVRMKKRGENKLYKRITEDGIDVTTPFAPDRPEKIYSEKGYQDLIL